ncbi:MAG: hypothetical protein KF704_08050 [Crocinitomicaceae bacterium]|nr:hypothetical protein [Crocinitomicaceae bacterium]
MNEQALQQQHANNCAQLKKLIYSWHLIPAASPNEFERLANTLLNQLYQTADQHKIERVLSGELTVVYGMHSSEFDAQKHTESIFSWWKENKNR